ncbi:hypothetical protein CTAYLR_001627 [Chrysophaeum taylorii]|uniref:Uncharacterized protein n=1 Tax=Chrysophaeum taylorii TaxID=2483200 RepID=A0AAD7UE69_9STRA|nr:hypothetical protein CTAYLR_001627 [Chrysophaeum taylorii]
MLWFAPTVAWSARRVVRCWYHVPVMAEEVVEYLVTAPNGTYVDGTLGGGGHSAALLEKLGPSATVVGVDRDAAAIDFARSRVRDPRFRCVEANFDTIDIACDGVLLDLGVSSKQLDDGGRGFSFRNEGPLDMRMGREGATAWGIVNRMDETEFSHLLRTFGEERLARRIARAVARARPIETTTQLAEVVEGVVPGPHKLKSVARVFQAIRLLVNDELGALERLLHKLPVIVNPGGRVVVISYHSLEDRRVKRAIRSGRVDVRDPPKDHFGANLSPWTDVLGSKAPLLPSQAEIARNPRARSAKLRVAQRRRR